MTSCSKFALTLFQKSLLFMHYLDPLGKTFTIGRVYRLVGSVDRNKLRTAFGVILDRHQQLRSGVTVTAGIPSWTLERFQSGDVIFISLADVRLGEKARELNERLKAEFDRPFDLSIPPLVRVILVKLADEDHLLLVTMPHIVTDDHALSLFVNALGQVYSDFIEGKSSKSQIYDGFREYAQNESNLAKSSSWTIALDYWRGNLTSIPSSLGLPSKAGGDIINPYEGAEAKFVLPLELVKQIGAASRRISITPYVLYLAAYGRTLQTLCGREEVIIGGLVANRLTVDAKRMMGPRVNTFALRLRSNSSNASYLRNVQKTVHNAYKTSNVPFEFVVQELKRSGVLSRDLIIEAVFDYFPKPDVVPSFSGLSVAVVEHPRRRAQVPITLKVSPVDDTIKVFLRYQLQYFNECSANCLFEHYLGFLDELSKSTSYNS